MGKFYIDINPNEPSVLMKSEPAVIRSDVPVVGQPVSGPLVVEQLAPEIIIQEKVVEKPVEIIREVVVEKIIEVPVEKIVTEIKTIEVPVEVIVEKEVIKEVEVPIEIERLVFREVVKLDTTKLVLAIVCSLLAGIILGKVL